MRYFVLFQNHAHGPFLTWADADHARRLVLIPGGRIVTELPRGR